MRYREILEACWKGYHKQGMKTMFGKRYPNCVKNKKTNEDQISNEKVRRIQNFLNDRFNANLDVDGVLGPLTIKSIDQFMPDAQKRLAPNPDRTTSVQGLEKKLNKSELEEDLRKWFKEKWVRFGPDGKIRGDCARGSSKEGKPKCLPQSKAQALGKKGRASSAAKKRREDPNPERRGPAKNVATKVRENEVKDLEKVLQNPHSYDAIDHMMQSIAKKSKITAKQLHDRFVSKHNKTPDDWIKNKGKK